MENKTQNQEQAQSARDVTLDELQQELDKLESKWIRIPQGEARVVVFTGKVQRRTAVFKNKDPNKPDDVVEQADFETAEKMKDGTPKIYSRSIMSPTTQAILGYLKQGQRELVLSADKGGKVGVTVLKR
jgi:predicted AlkP superfamily phosphohydrolase/phosphomutase